MIAGKTRMLTLIAACALLAAPTARAADAPDAGAEVQGQGGVRLECGGVGLDESAPLRSARGHALQLLFTDMDGAWLADVDVRIRNAAGSVLAETRCGPVAVIYVTESGSYRVSAVSAGVPRESEFKLSPGAEVRSVMRWLD